MSLDSQLASGLDALETPLQPVARARLIAYVALIGKWNRVHNLTAIREPERMVDVHLLDSLSLLPYLAEAKSLLDVGSGAGLPGIPLAIARPDLFVTLLDSSHKKASFLRQAKSELDLGNVEVICERVENWHPGRTFDVVVSRAFAEIVDFVTQSRHLVAPEGALIAMKGVYPFEEIAKVPVTHRVDNIVALRVPAVEAERHLVFLRAA